MHACCYGKIYIIVDRTGIIALKTSRYAHKTLVIASKSLPIAR